MTRKLLLSALTVAVVATTVPAMSGNNEAAIAAAQERIAPIQQRIEASQSLLKQILVSSGADEQQMEQAFEFVNGFVRNFSREVAANPAKLNDYDMYIDMKVVPQLEALGLANAYDIAAVIPEWNDAAVTLHLAKLELALQNQD